MFATLLSKEVRHHLLTFRFAAALATTLILVIVSVWVLGDDYIRRSNAYNLAAEASAQADREIYVPSEISPTLHRPPSSLSIFAQGEDRRFGNTVQVNRWEVPREAEGSFNDNMLLAAEPALDLHTIFAIVVSLFGILFSYDAVSGERESGTLKLQCTTPISRGTLFAAKFTGGVICLAIPFLLSFTSGLILLSFFSGLRFTPEQWSAIGLMVFAGLLYGAAFVATGLACSATVRRSSVALVLSLLVWAVFVLLIPSAANSAADILAPMPSPAAIANVEKTSLQEAAASLREFGERYPNYWLGLYTGGWSIPGRGGCLKFDGREVDYRHGEAWVRTFEPMMQGRAQRIWDAFYRGEGQRRRHAEVFETLSLPSPTHHLRRAFMALAKTDYRVYGDFLEGARRYRRQMITDFESRGYFSDNASQFFSRRPISEIDDERFLARARYYRQQRALNRPAREYLSPELWGPLPAEAIPQFEHHPAESDFVGSLQPIGILTTIAAIIFAIGFVAFIRYDVR